MPVAGQWPLAAILVGQLDFGQLAWRGAWCDAMTSLGLCQLLWKLCQEEFGTGDTEAVACQHYDILVFLLKSHLPFSFHLQLSRVERHGITTDEALLSCSEEELHEVGLPDWCHARIKTARSGNLKTDEKSGWVMVETDWVVVPSQADEDKQTFMMPVERRVNPKLGGDAMKRPGHPLSISRLFAVLKKQSVMI